MEKTFNGITVKEYLEHRHENSFENQHREFNKAFLKEYPFMEARSVWTDEGLDDPYDFTWFDDFPNGWAIAFGIDMLNEIKQVLTEHDYMDEFRVLQIKEKFGGLRFYYGACPGEIFDAMVDIVDKYEEMSYNICINCGAPAEYESKGWICPFCKECAEKGLEKRNEYCIKNDLKLYTLEDCYVKIEGKS